MKPSADSWPPGVWRALGFVKLGAAVPWSRSRNFKPLPICLFQGTPFFCLLYFYACVREGICRNICVLHVCLVPRKAMRGQQIFWNWHYGWLSYHTGPVNWTWVFCKGSTISELLAFLLTFFLLWFGFLLFLFKQPCHLAQANFYAIRAPSVSFNLWRTWFLSASSHQC